jgi:hypothetical protein
LAVRLMALSIIISSRCVFDDWRDFEAWSLFLL